MKSSSALLSALLFLIPMIGFGHGARPLGPQTDNMGANTVTILVTPQAHNKKEAEAADKLTDDDFAVKENGRPQKVLSAKPAAGTPMVVEVLIQDNLKGRIDDELKGLKDFIRGLPRGSRVLVGYLTTGTMDVRHDFTDDLEAAAGSLRVLTGRSPYDPYSEVIEGIRRFDSQPRGRRIVVLVSDGLDLSHGVSDSNPEDSIDLGRAIREAQTSGVTIFSFFEPTREPGNIDKRLDVTFGQGSLDKISSETGGDAFLGPTDVVSLSPYLAQMKDELTRQWLVTYQSANTGAGFRHVQIAAEKGAHLHYMHGYWVK
jgi:VWFA-related protein